MQNETEFTAEIKQNLSDESKKHLDSNDSTRIVISKCHDRNFIAALGFFAVIMLSFTVGFTLSSAYVLQYLGTASIFRLLLVIDILAAVFVNSIYLIGKLIGSVFHIDTHVFCIKKYNKAFLIFTALLLFAWLFSLNALPAFLRNFLPW